MNENQFRSWLDGDVFARAVGRGRAARRRAGARCTDFREWWHRQETAA